MQAPQPAREDATEQDILAAIDDILAAIDRAQPAAGDRAQQLAQPDNAAHAGGAPAARVVTQPQAIMLPAVVAAPAPQPGQLAATSTALETRVSDQTLMGVPSVDKRRSSRKGKPDWVSMGMLETGLLLIICMLFSQQLEYTPTEPH